MVNNLYDWITIALHGEFGSDYTYYIEDVEQNLNKPCFVVGNLTPIIIARSPVKYRRAIPIIIHYFTDKDNTVNAKKDCYEIAERLFSTLEYLNGTDNGKSVLIRGTDISWELVDGVLQFFITYIFDVVKEIEQTLMEDGVYNNTPLPK